MKSSSRNLTFTWIFASRSVAHLSCALGSANLLGLRLQQWCFPVDFVKFLRTPFFIEHLPWLLLAKEAKNFLYISKSVTLQKLHSNRNVSSVLECARDLKYDKKVKEHRQTDCPNTCICAEVSVFFSH